MSNDSGAGGQDSLTDADALLLTEARTARWKLESYEFAYDARIQVLNRYKTALEFLAVLVAVVFLFLQYLFKEDTDLHNLLAYVGTALSLVVILMVIWGHMSRWTDQIEKKRDLSRGLREMIQVHERVTTARPVDEKKIRKWLHDCLAAEEARKHDLAMLPEYYMKCGFQHVGNLYPGRGVKCGMCGKEWTPESNKRAKWTWVPFYGCKSCGV
jgi:mobilome CxxCx(11)CxxC protein